MSMNSSCASVVSNWLSDERNINWHDRSRTSPGFEEDLPGWNFLFIGATQLLTETYTPAERGKTQALNDFLVFTTVTLAVLSAGHLQHHLGWRAVNLGVVPLILTIFTALAWLIRRRRQPVASVSG